MFVVFNSLSNIHLFFSEIFLTSLSVKMERERRAPHTATGTNLGSEYIPSVSNLLTYFFKHVINTVDRVKSVSES